MLYDKKIVYNAIKTPDGTIIRSRHTHDYVVHIDATNGKEYMIDGGLDYIRCSANGDEIYLTKYYEDGHDTVRECLEWGYRGKDGKQPLKYKKIKDMSTDHIEACLSTQSVLNHPHSVGNVYRLAMIDELQYRITKSGSKASGINLNI